MGFFCINHIYRSISDDFGDTQCLHIIVHYCPTIWHHMTLDQCATFHDSFQVKRGDASGCRRCRSRSPFLSCWKSLDRFGSESKPHNIYIWNIYYKIWWLVIELIHSSADVSHQCRSEEANSRHFSLPMLAIVSSQSHTYLTAAYSGDTVDDMATQCTWAQPITVEN